VQCVHSVSDLTCRRFASSPNVSNSCVDLVSSSGLGMDVYTLAISIFIGTHYLLVGDEERLGGVNSALNNAARDASAGGRKLFARTVEDTSTGALSRHGLCVSTARRTRTSDEIGCRQSTPITGSYSGN
jgi:hypothetical protein